MQTGLVPGKCDERARIASYGFKESGRIPSGAARPPDCAKTSWVNIGERPRTGVNEPKTEPRRWALACAVIAESWGEAYRRG